MIIAAWLLAVRIVVVAMVMTVLHKDLINSSDSVIYKISGGADY